jgi:hypothetical protein
MTEKEYFDIGARDSELLLHWLAFGPRLSHRKLRLYGCACCRAVWALLKKKASRDAVEVAERFADGLADEKDLDQANVAAIQARSGLKGRQYRAAVMAAGLVWSSSLLEGAFCRRRLSPKDGLKNAETWSLLQDIAGNPFHSWTDPRMPMLRTGQLPPGMCSEICWLDLRWLTSDVLGVARDAYENRRFDLLPVLADALDDSGFPFNHVQEHLRSPGPHVLGCWALDLLLGKD